MDNDRMLEVYDQIKKTIMNPKSKASSICNELLNKHPFLERLDVIHYLFIKFVEVRIKAKEGDNYTPIKYLNTYIWRFCYYELMNMKRTLSHRQTDSLENLSAKLKEYTH